MASLFSPTPDLSVEEDEEEQAAMSNMSIDIEIHSLLSGVFKVFNSLALSALRFLAPARSPPTVGYHK